ncbi:MULTISPECIES: hypothetical protein [Acinetobacter]|uniref:Uncharacterized protein n=1 Tax=Acinetobacter variabilis TaxID=70346 RepID=N8VD49_9GAMM|nr:MULTISPECIES: hypothetical protein [Acinetobacter]ENU97871.1 hypothetical protein F969_03248 [Acinetobacter variabilis]
MTDFDDDFDLEEPYPDKDLYPDYTKKKCSSCSGTGYNVVEASVSNVWEPEKLVR